MGERYPGLELDEDLRLQRIEWTVLRVAWPLLYALLAAIVLGLLGDGPLADARAGDADGTLALQWRRFATVKSTTELAATVRPADGLARLRLARAWVESVEIRTVVPEPLRVVSRDEAIELEFAAAAGGPVRVRLFVEPQRPGRLHGWAAAGDGERSRFRQFVYP